MKRYFRDYIEAEDFANDMVFGGDDPRIVAELVEVWSDEDAWDRSVADPDNPKYWGKMYAVWGTEAELEDEIAQLGEFINRKGITGRSEES